MRWNNEPLGHLIGDLCAEVCPVEAIFFEDDLPEQFAAFKARNAAFYS